VDKSAHTEYLRGTNLRIQFYIIPITVPEVTSVGKQVVHLVRTFFLKPPRFNWYIDPSRVFIVGIQVYYHIDYAREVISMLAVANQFLVGGRVELKVIIALES